MKKKFVRMLVCILTVTNLLAQTLSIDAKCLKAGVLMDSDISLWSSVGGVDLAEMDSSVATSADIYAPTATDEVYTISDVYVSAQLSTEDTISFAVSNEGFATIKEWSISFEAEYDIIASDGVEVLDNSDVKTIAPKDAVSLKAGDVYKFTLTVEDDTVLDTNVEYRVYGVFDEASINQCDEEYLDSLLTSSDFVEYDCKTGEERLVTVDPEDVEVLDAFSSQASKRKTTYSVVEPIYEIEAGDAEIKSVIGKDNRKRVTAVKTDPYYKIGFLYITDASGGTHIGTGFLISKNYMLTAAHCVYMSGSAVKSITAYFGANGNSYGVSANSSVVGWCSSYPSTKSIANDWGYIKLDSNVGNTCGWFGIGYTTNAKLKSASFVICGYPGDKVSYNKKSTMHGQNVQMWKDSGKLRKVYKGYITYTMDTYGGQSGSPVYNSSTQIVYGIHHGEAVSGSTNGAARITKGIFTHLKNIGACS